MAPLRYLFVLPLLACCGPSMPSPPSGPPTGVIYFEYDLPGGGDPAAWQVLPDGSEFGRVPHPFDRVVTPHVGLSGRWLAYSESGDIFMADLSNPAGLPQLPQYDITFVGTRNFPLVSPTGQLVANTYLGPDPGSRGIRISRNDQSGVETYLTPLGQVIDNQRAIGWFPDEDSLMILQTHGDRVYSIIRADGSGQRSPGIPDINLANSVALSPTGRFVALAAPGNATIGDSASRTITVYNLATKRVVHRITLNHPVWSVTWSPDERFLAYQPIPDVTDEFDLAIIELTSENRTVVLQIPGLIFRPSWTTEPPQP